MSKHWKTVFYIAGGFNIMAALPGILNTKKGAELFFGFPVEDEQAIFLLQMLLPFILLFGIGYIMVGRNISKNHGIIVLGMIGKFIFAGQAVFGFMNQQISQLTFIGGVGDLIWGTIFGVFLYQFYRKD